MKSGMYDFERSNQSGSRALGVERAGSRRRIAGVGVATIRRVEA